MHTTYYWLAFARMLSQILQVEILLDKNKNATTGFQEDANRQRHD
jgi:hypothetical protein